jgi:hypothetical protein
MTRQRAVRHNEGEAAQGSAIHSTTTQPTRDASASVHATLARSWIGFIVLALAACGGKDLKDAKTSNPVVVTISPTSGILTTSSTLQFTSTVAGTSNQNVKWTASSGTVTSTGLFTAPAQVPNPSTVTVTATAAANTDYSAAAEIIIQAGGNTKSVTLSPSSGTVAPFGSLQFASIVSGDSDTAVTWYVNAVKGGNQSIGYISSNGLFLAPSGVPTKTTGSTTAATTTAISAVLNDDPTYSATANVTIRPANQSTQTAPIALGASGGSLRDTSTDGTTTFCCGGTLGALLSANNQQYVLSTAHTLARLLPKVGDPVVQPSLLDANCDATRVSTIANLSQFFDLGGSAQPAVDAAIAAAVQGQIDTTGKILYLGSTLDANNVPVAEPPHAGTGVPADASLVGMEVAKSGRSTGLTCSTVDSVSVTMNVEYTENCDGTGTPTNVQFSGQVEISGGWFSAQGDSGALVVSQQTADPVGLLFASSDSSTLANPISDVLNYFSSALSTSAAIVGGDAHPVIGCSLPITTSSGSVGASKVSAERLSRATKIRDAHLTQIANYASVKSTAVQASLDNPEDPAIVFYVTKGANTAELPREIEGVRTRTVETDTVTDSQEIPSIATTGLSMSKSEFARVQAVHALRAQSLLKQIGIQGVGISPSLDASGEGSLMIYVIRGVAYPAIPATIDGVRTRVRESSRFRANYGSAGRSCRAPRETSAIRSKTPRSSN